MGFVGYPQQPSALMTQPFSPLRGYNLPDSSSIRIGIDLGGTKIEALALDHAGNELGRHRVPTPRDDYKGTLQAMADLVFRLETETGRKATVGAGIPGTISGVTGLVKNANSTWLNGKPLQEDLGQLLSREVRIANDANCLAVSEATDGAAAGKAVVFAVILGTGCGGGVSFQGHVHSGPNGVSGEWGHMPLPWPSVDENPGPSCYCGKHGCMEQWVSGTGVAQDFRNVTGKSLTTREIVAIAEAGSAEALDTMHRFEDRLARGLAQVVHILDPDIIVFGGGLSQYKGFYRTLGERMIPYVFGGEFDTALVPALHGDSSGVRGAAWLWPLTR
ncbi:ROK family protein [Granulicella tundricola MP5ACTX9]|uniref:ROK family protein n=1 Tax=Granulicella tundricola (strain ATCC BAA-1859 / DSM 23138 / MP5ACTX9) TaxID=1198114 RepID=E8X1I4_GRATM|nr:ROK family protein [Granulicella tundricola MP5ACTX9]